MCDAVHRRIALHGVTGSKVSSASTCCPRSNVVYGTTTSIIGELNLHVSFRKVTMKYDQITNELSMFLNNCGRLFAKPGRRHEVSVNSKVVQTPGTQKNQNCISGEGILHTWYCCTCLPVRLRLWLNIFVLVAALLRMLKADYDRAVRLCSQSIEGGFDLRPSDTSKEGLPFDATHSLRRQMFSRFDSC